MSTIPPSPAPLPAPGFGPMGGAGAAATSSSRRRRRAAGLRRRDALHNWTLHFGPNMTPMVDVVMVILIFFMASAAFMGNEWFLRAAIPFDAGRGTNTSRPNDPLALPPVRLDVFLDADDTGRTSVDFLELKRATIEAFIARVSAFPKDAETAKIEVVIRPTPRVPYQDVVRAHAACDAAGMYKVGISVARGGGSGGSGGAPK